MREASVTAGPFLGRWQRFLRFSVRPPIVFVFVIGAVLGWLARSTRIQREAVAAIESTGGAVAYHWKFDNGLVVRNAKPWAPGWLVNFIGVNYFGHVAAVRLVRSSSKIDEPIVQIGRFKQLQRLDLVRSSLSDDDLSHLKGLTKLSTLDLSNTRVSDAGVNELQQTLPNLRITRWYNVRPIGPE
jgi:Leucine-rich repeat (LRR) protein